MPNRLVVAPVPIALGGTRFQIAKDQSGCPSLNKSDSDFVQSIKSIARCQWVVEKIFGVLSQGLVSRIINARKCLIDKDLGEPIRLKRILFILRYELLYTMD